MSERPTEERFLSDVAEHQMHIIRDDGVHRHIMFKKPETGCMHFQLITWPGYLCYTGDMGTYVFSRLDDMFEFFRTDAKYWQRNDGRKLHINPGYWSEKIQAEDRAGVKVYSADKFRECIGELLKNHEEFEAEKHSRRYEADSEFVPDQELREAIEEEVLSYADEGEREARCAANEFQWKGEQFFTDFWEFDLRDYTYRFIWCCYAMTWGIQQYDKQKETATK